MPTMAITTATEIAVKMIIATMIVKVKGNVIVLWIVLKMMRAWEIAVKMKCYNHLLLEMKVFPLLI